MLALLPQGCFRACNPYLHFTSPVRTFKGYQRFYEWVILSTLHVSPNMVNNIDFLIRIIYLGYPRYNS